MNKKINFYSALRFAVDLNEYATKAKRGLVQDTTEYQYWQGTADAARKFATILHGWDMYSDLFPEVKVDSETH